MYFQLVDNQALFNPGDINLMCSTCTALPRATDSAVPPTFDTADVITTKTQGAGAHYRLQAK